ncbi:MAG: Enoyl-[acyl-carrier-protein] reductase [NADPH] FabI [Phycisphaerae bacterium]|nr:Enoyl-[acyl-carrier-protein] reductase [NADPH] FabI [Phycisphaerae bacterium]
MSFLQLSGKTFLICGIANRKSVAYHIGQVLEAEGATVIYSTRTPERREQLLKLLPGRSILVCDVQQDRQIVALADEVGRLLPAGGRLSGLVHSLAFANYQNFSGQFHEVNRADFLQAVDISCYSLIALANALKECFAEDAGVVTISISSTQMAAESYGYMAPAKAALDSTITFLAKSFSRISKVRFNAVGAGLLKTNSSAGIPNYLDNYLYAEQATLRKAALTTEEVANVAAFLLSPRSSGINAQTIITDAGMGKNYFDARIVQATTQQVWPRADTSPL